MLRPTVAALAALFASAAAAQPVLDFRDELARTRPEAWALRWFGAALEPSGVGAPARQEAGAIELGAELGWLPSLSTEQRTVGFGGTKTEDLNRAPAYARLRATVGVGAGWTLGVGWIPPVEVDDASGDVWSATLGRPLIERERFRLAATLVGLAGTIEGDFTCPAAAAAAGEDPVANPYGCAAASADEMRLEAWGVELAAAWTWRRRPALETHLAATLRRLDAEFRVDARYDGLIDRSVLAYDGDEWSLAAGLSYRAGARARLAGEVVYAPLDVVRDPLGRGGAEDDALLQVRLLLAWRAR